MKKTTALLLSAALACTSLLGTAIPAFAEDGDITLDVIICQYGPNTNEWFWEAAWTEPTLWINLRLKIRASN